MVAKDGQAVVKAAGTEVTVTTRQQTWVERASAPTAPQPARRDVVGARFYLVDDLTNGAIASSDMLGASAVSSWLVFIAILVPFVVVATGDLVLVRRRCLATAMVGLPDTEVSRHHARITQQPEGYIVEDLDSTNGAFANGQRVTRQRLQDGDEIRIGQARLIFEVHPVQEVTP